MRANRGYIRTMRVDRADRRLFGREIAGRGLGTLGTAGWSGCRGILLGFRRVRFGRGRDGNPPLIIDGEADGHQDRHHQGKLGPDRASPAADRFRARFGIGIRRRRYRGTLVEKRSTLVVDGSPLRIAERLVGLMNFPEAFFRLRICRVPVRVPDEAGFPKSAFDFIQAG